MAALVDIRGIVHEVGGRRILDGVCWRIDAGRHWAVLGPNGAGKTTLLKVVCGYLWPNGGGEVYHNGELLLDLRRLRESIGWVSASLAEQTPAYETVLRTVVSGKLGQIGLWEYHGVELSDADFERAARYLDEMGAGHLARQRFGTLSQGERQRVLISRARMARPGLLILDEPCAGLDPGGRERLLDLIGKLACEQGGMGLVLVTQHVEEIPPMFEDTLVLSGGKVVRAGATSEVLSSQMMREVYGLEVEIVTRGGRRWSLPRE